MQTILFVSYPDGYVSSFLYFVSVITVIVGIYIIISKNPIISVLFLIGLFCGISVYLIMIGLHFLALSYLLVYVGAISILFIFILMLINIRVSELITDNKNSVPLAILAALFFNFTLNNILVYNTYNTDFFDKRTINSIGIFINNIKSEAKVGTKDITSIIMEYIYYTKVSNVASKSWDSIAVVNSHINSIGNILYSNLFILLIVTSLILLLAMIGAIIITISKPKSLDYAH